MKSTFKNIGTLLIFCLASQLAFADRIVIRHRHAATTNKVVVVKPNRQSRMGYVDINGAPKKAKVFVNGTYAGLAGSFDGFPGKLTLKPGVYTIKVVHGNSSYKQKLRVTRGHEINMKVAL